MSSLKNNIYKSFTQELAAPAVYEAIGLCDNAALTHFKYPMLKELPMNITMWNCYV